MVTGFPSFLVSAIMVVAFGRTMPYPTQLRTIVRNQGILKDIEVSTEWPDDDNNHGSRVKVIAEYDFNPLVSWIGLPKIGLKATSQMVISYC